MSQTTSALAGLAGNKTVGAASSSLLPVQQEASIHTPERRDLEELAGGRANGARSLRVDARVGCCPSTPSWARSAAMSERETPRKMPTGQGWPGLCSLTCQGLRFPPAATTSRLPETQPASCCFALDLLLYRGVFLTLHSSIFHIFQ